jgi:predicted transposase/invertase (TIGR01784 family)
MAKRGRKQKGVLADEILNSPPQISIEEKTERGAASRLLPLKNDLVFKLVFGDHRYIAIIRAFLIAALDIPAEEYEDLKIIDPHLERDSPADKLGILDVRIQLKNKKLIAVEVQIRKTPYMAERVAFSTGRNLARQISPGQDYAAIERVVTIVIADHDMISADNSYHHVFKLYDKDNGVLLTDVMEIHTLDLRKLPETADIGGKEGELLDWLRLIRSEDEEEIEMLATKTDEMKMTVGHLKVLSADESARMLYEARELYLMDEAVRRRVAVAEGEARGEARGEAKGEAKRIEDKLEVARNFVKMGLPPEQVAQGTGLSVEEISALR